VKGEELGSFLGEEILRLVEWLKSRAPA
jgi:hypothetical protein